MTDQRIDVLIIGGSTGGCAAALAAAAMGKRVVMTEETDWLGGQLTSQAVPADENRWIESFGCTQRYRAFRNGVRQYYRDHYPLTPAARSDPHLNPGLGRVSRICCEPRVALAVLEQMLAPHRAAGRIRILLEHKPVAAETDGDRVTAVRLRDLREGNEITLTAPYVLDATELGDLLPLAGVEYVSGAESRDETGEPHAVDGPAQPDNVQSLSWCFPMGYDPDGEHVIDRPDQYGFWRDYEPQMTPAWPGKMLSWDQCQPATLQHVHRKLMPEHGKWALWLFRRILTQEHYPSGAMPHEITLVNWPMIDYVEGNIIDASPQDQTRYLQQARQQSLSFLFWMQTEAPRPEGGTGYPGLFLVPDVVGTTDGLAKYPYIRESRRIRAVFTVTENHVGKEARGTDQVEKFPDSVGIGHYNIDLHPSTNGINYIDIPSLPFQIPLGSLIPQRVENLLPACKNLGVTHITNGCYRLHPVEWNIGEAAGALAAFCLDRGLAPRQVHGTPEHLEAFQALLTDQGFELDWPVVKT